jgi:predicted glycosyltransferase
MHDAIAFAGMVFGESATMATEAAVLGVPAIYLDNTSRLYTKEIENKYGLIFNFSESEKDQVNAIEKAIEVLQKPKRVWEEGRRKLLDDKINVTDFLVWFVENYPESISQIKKDPAYQLKFN